MCTTCGCASGLVKIDGESVDHAHDHGQHGSHEHVHADGTRHRHDHDHSHDHSCGHDHDHTRHHHHGEEAAHSHAPGLSQTRMVQIEQDILSKNNAFAQANRQRLAQQGIFALNLVSSPGSGKTTLLCKTIQMLGAQAVAVIEGDQQTSQDAERIRATGASAIQINTGKGCHLDAHMVGQAMAKLPLTDNTLLMIENVGNLVCPAAFDLGEAHKVAVLSVTEGEDKPIKYPDMFRAASVMLLNKIDLLPFLTYDVDAAIGFARRVNPRIRVIQVSATTGAGMDEWLQFLRDGAKVASYSRRPVVVPASAPSSEPAAQL